ncbi:RING finger protein [Acrasis kona]|uniref:RING finger protein 141 n=1 Tax=Acrasis kona TaxID=1008807 RepID=A0AAW2ZJK9_9EUKA
MGNEQSTSANISVAVLEAHADFANRVFKEKIPFKEFYLKFKINSAKNVNIMIYKVFESGEEEWRKINPGIFEKIINRVQMEASTFLKTKGDEEEEEECAICMEQKSEVTLPCTHSFCHDCIQKWNLTSKTCPTCRVEANVNDPNYQDQTWVLQDTPTNEEVAEQLYIYIDEVTFIKNIENKIKEWNPFDVEK